MDVVCDRCRAEYEFDDALVSERGTTVKCTSCGHQFKIYRTSAHPEGARSWNLKRLDGTTIPFDSLAVLQKWILEGRVTKTDEISRAGEPWKPLGAIAELESFFSTADLRASQVPPRAAPRSAPPSPPSRPPSRVTTPGSTSAASRLPEMPDSSLRGATLRPGGPPPPATTAHGVPPPPPMRTAEVSDTSATAQLGTPMLPPRVPVDADLSPPPRAATSTVDGYALGATSNDVAVPAPPVRAAPTAASAPSVSEPPVPLDDALPQAQRSSSRGVVLGLAVGVGVAAVLVLGGWRLGYLGPARPAPPAAGASTVLRSLEAARALTRSYSSRSLEDARDELTRSLALDPTNVRASAARAEVMAAWSELLSDAATDLEARAANPGADVPALRAEAALLRREASERLVRARADVPTAGQGVANLRAGERAEVEAYLADVSRVAGDRAAAEQHLVAARAAGPSQEADLVAALLLRDRDEQTQAAEALQRIIAGQPDSVRAQLALARIALARGDASAATTALDAIARAAPDHDALARLRARIVPVGDASVATAPLVPPPMPDVLVAAPAPTERALAREAPPTAGRSYNDLVGDGDRLQDEGRSGPARERYRAALALRANGCEALAGLGFVDLEERELSSAVSNFRRSISANASYGEAYIGLGEALTSMGNYQQALDAYNRYLQVNPGGSHAHMARRQIESLQERLGSTPDRAASPAGTGSAGN